MGRFEAIWLAFEKFAIFFSFVVTMTVVVVLCSWGLACAGSAFAARPARRHPLPIDRPGGWAGGRL